MKSKRLPLVFTFTLMLVSNGGDGRSNPGLSNAAEPTPLASVNDAQKTQQQALAAYVARRKADQSSFREAFERGKLLSVYQRLNEAAAVTGELAALASNVKDSTTAREVAHHGFTSRSAIYPRTSHLVRLACARPWIRNEPPFARSIYDLRVDTEELSWPTEKEKPELRRIIEGGPTSVSQNGGFEKPPGEGMAVAGDPDILAMAIEALASLHDPSDIRLISEVRRRHVAFREPAVTVPVLAAQQAFSANGIVAAHEDDPLLFLVYWRQATTIEYANRAIRSMTGTDVHADQFPAWVESHGADRNSFWYWQQRLQREFDGLDLTIARLTQDNPTVEHLPELRTAKETELKRSLRAELAMLDRHTEAKVLLLSKHRHAGAADVDDNVRRFFDPPWVTRLTKDELIQLLSGKRLWDDIDWTDQYGHAREFDDLLATRILLSAEKVFSRDDVKRLEDLYIHPKLQLYWSGKAAWMIGISRLLSPAEPSDLDRRETRDGYLRSSIIQEKDLFTSGYITRELVRVGLPNNARFLRELYFCETDETTMPNLRCSILIALGQPPLTAEKRRLLMELINDKRSRPLLTRPLRRMGDDLYQHYAIQSINAHAGRELVDFMEKQALRDESTSGAVLDRILQKLKAFDAEAEKDSVKTK